MGVAKITTSQVAMMLGVNESTVRQWAARGHLTRAGRRGRQQTYPLSEVEKMKNEWFPRVADEHHK